METTNNYKKLNLETKLRVLNDELKASKDRLNKDFNYELNWVLRRIYDCNQWIEVLTFILKTPGDEIQEDDKIDILVEHLIETYKEFLLRSYNVRKRSTCEVTNMTSTWEFENKVEILKFLEDLK